MVTPEGVATVYGTGFALTLGIYLIALKVGIAVSAIRKT
jgi:hypothetical protein